MVGAPKHLHDLNGIGADVRVTCRVCGFEVDWKVAELSAPDLDRRQPELVGRDAPSRL